MIDIIGKHLHLFFKMQLVSKTDRHMQHGLTGIQRDAPLNLFIIATLNIHVFVDLLAHIDTLIFMF